ncbi:MAG TPA: hypothetical protein PLJ38_06335, partial [bacterium]|nr:hypothetical protein [bacterium]
LGLSLKNLISKDFRYYQKKYNLPKQYIIGTSYNFEILPNINFILNNDYTINTQNTDNNLAFGFDVQFNSIIQNSKINFLYGIDNIYIAHSFGIRFEYQNSFNCGFAYALNKNKELGDNTLFFLGWQFGAIEEKKYEKYLELEAAGERAYRGGDWNTALECWQQAAALYPLKKTNAKVSFDLLTNHLQKIEKLNLELYKSNKNHFENGLQYFKNQNYYEALLQFLAIKYADDFNNKNIYNDAIYYIKQITEKFKNIGDASQSPTKSDTFNTATSQQLQEDTDRINLSNIINAFIEMNRLELAEEYLKKYTFSDTEKIIIEKQIIDKRLKLKDYETAKIRYQQLTIELRAAFKNNDYQKVIEIYNILQNNYKNYDFQRNSDFEIYYNLALENFNAAKDSPRKITNAELMQIEDYYKSAAKHYLNYLQTKNKTELFNSIIFYERILKIDPEHKSKAEYLKIKKLYEEQ